MKLKDLKQAVIELGFDTELESEGAFLYALNRAVIEVNDIAPKLRAYEYINSKLANALKGFETYRKGYGEQLYFYADNPKAYYFESNGRGQAVIEKLEGNEWVTETTIDLLGGGYKAYKGLIASEGRNRIRFTANYIYFVKNVALYTELLSDEETDIPPYVPFARLDISAEDSFYGLTKEVVNELGEAYIRDKDYLVEDNKVILVPYGKEGVFKIWYKVYPKQYTFDDLGSELSIDLDEDIASLLPELVASYIWLDGENIQKAQLYYERYKVRAMTVTSKRKKDTSAFIYKTRGWA